MVAHVRRLSALLGLVAMMVLVLASTALATSHNVALETAITGAADDVTANVTALLPTILGVAALLMVISIAWKFFRRFVR